jgi:hypothetical protein
MHKDVEPKPMEPFTREEERGLVERIDALSMASLESYIASARCALENNALAPTWRPRIEFGAQHAERALAKAKAAAASDAVAPPPAALPAASKAKKATAAIAQSEPEQESDEE